MDAPQSRAEIQPTVDELRRLDSLLDVRWNPRVLVLEPMRFDSLGKITPARYDGRWEVVRAKTPHVRTAGDRLSEDDVAVIYQVRDPATGDYKPIGPWLVEYMRRWDSQQAHFRDEMERLRRKEEADEARLMQVDEGAVEHAVHQLAFAAKHEGGRSVFFGQGVDLAALERRARAAIAPPDGESALIPQRTHSTGGL